MTIPLFTLAKQPSQTKHLRVTCSEFRACAYVVFTSLSTSVDDRRSNLFCCFAEFRENVFCKKANMDVNLRMITKKSTFKALMTLTKAKKQSIPELSDLQVHCRIPLHRHNIKIKPQCSWFSLHQRNSGLKHTKRALQNDTTQTHQLLQF